LSRRLEECSEAVQRRSRLKCVRIESADERDSRWEDARPRYRVYFFRGGERPGHSWSVLVNDVLDAEVLEVIAWAEREIGDEGLFAVALVDQSSSGERGLVWLVGMDANDDPRDELEESLRAAMESRRGRATVRLPSA
jgi:hypothetical protein